MKLREKRKKFSVITKKNQKISMNSKVNLKKQETKRHNWLKG